MHLQSDKTMHKFYENFHEEIYPIGLPSWSAKAKPFLKNYAHKAVEIKRRDWSLYIANQLSVANERVLFHLDWPLVSQDMRSEVLSMLQDCLLHDVYVNASFRSQEGMPGGWPLFMRFESQNNTRKISGYTYEHKDHFSFMIIDQLLVLQVPSRPYHQNLKFFEIPDIREYEITNISEIFFA